jgi:Flp pilus assembly protein TadG
MPILTMRAAFYRASSIVRRFEGDRRGATAVEFAMIVPVMLLVLFATYDLTNGFAAQRKVTITSRTLSDLISQASQPLLDGDFTNAFDASEQIMKPFADTPVQTISEIVVDATGSSTTAKIVWSKAWNGSAYINSPFTQNATTTVPAELVEPKQKIYLLRSDVTFTYTPVSTYFLKQNLPLSNTFYTRPRQLTCVQYNVGSNFVPSTC